MKTINDLLIEEGHKHIIRDDGISVRISNGNLFFFYSGLIHLSMCKQDVRDVGFYDYENRIFVRHVADDRSIIYGFGFCKVAMDILNPELIAVRYAPESCDYLIGGEQFKDLRIHARLKDCEEQYIVRVDQMFKEKV